ncbi:MAG: FtsX-like permease family protein [Candidatus Lokiarchaeota archaeon]|nr:FtsX-like permease family protein [Candidatus Lokiarchaeota archaeon]
MKINLTKFVALLHTFYLYSSKNKIRFTLMLLGMTIGIFSVTSVLIVSSVGRKIINTEIASFGMNRVWIHRSLPELVDYFDYNPKTNAKLISIDETKWLKNYCPNITKIAPSICWTVSAKRGGKLFEGIKLIGTLPDWKFIHNESLKEGRFLLPVDEIKRNLVCILSHEAYETIFGNTHALGSFLQVTNEYFKIVGILKPKDRPFLESMNLVKGGNDVIFIPFSLMRSQTWFNTNFVQGLDLQVANFNESQKAGKNIENYFRIQHGNQASVKVNMLHQQIRSAKRILRTITIVLTLIALIALILAGTGIMNIMLSSVSERIYEIGIRRAVGATRHDILFQFLVESVATGFIGGILGITGGIGIYYMTQLWLGICKISLVPAISIATSVSIITGIIAGIYPAQKAANLKPIDALRNI